MLQEDNLSAMPHLKLTVLSLRYSSWSMRPWLALTHAGAAFSKETVELAHMQQQADFSSGTIDLTNVQPTPLSDRRALGSVHGLFPVLRVDDVPIHESLAICEYVAEAFPAAGLWPEDPVDRAEADRRPRVADYLVKPLTRRAVGHLADRFGSPPGDDPAT